MTNNTDSEVSAADQEEISNSIAFGQPAKTENIARRRLVLTAVDQELGGIPDTFTIFRFSHPEAWQFGYEDRCCCRWD
ncbi:MAG: hypothetical protein WC453_01055 [Patescibacteria group bacterium]